MRAKREFLSDMLGGVGASTVMVGLLLIALLAVGIIPLNSSYGGILSLLLLPIFTIAGVLMVFFGCVLDHHPALPTVAGGSPEPSDAEETSKAAS